MAFYNHQKTHNNTRIHQLVTNRLSYDSKLIFYQQQIRKNITSSFQSKNDKQRAALLQNSSLQQEEFNNIYQNILSDAKKKHPPEKVESNIRQLYDNNGVGNECDYTSKHTERKRQSKPVSILDSIGSFFSRVLGKGDTQKLQQKFLHELVTHIDGLLIPIKRYSDNIVQEAINYTRTKLADWSTNSNTVRDRAHQIVYALLIERLTEKQHEWERHNSISVRLNYAAEDLWNFYHNTIQGIVGVKLLTSDLKLILWKHDRAGLIDTIIKYIVHDLQSEAWVKHSRVLMARVDLDLLKQIEEGRIDEMIYNVTHSSEHYQKIVDQLIQEKVTACVKEQLVHYHNSLKSSFHYTVVKTEAWRNPICHENEKDKTKVSQGRTRFFLQELVHNFTEYKLPVIYADAVRALNSENYIRCDDEPTDMWKQMVKDLFEASAEKSAVELTEDDRRSILKSALDEMINNQNNEAVKMRCSQPCPTCKMPCKRASGHTTSLDENERRHDCDHQSSGLGGDYWENPSRSNYQELVYESCSNSVAADNLFSIDGVFHSYREFAVHYPWLTPRATTEAMHEVRQYIFYTYQQQLATFFRRLPCSNIPPSFNHQRSALRASLNKIIIENN